MGEKDFLVDAVAQFLQTNEWQESITQFFALHYVKFPLETTDEKQRKGVGYTLEQYDVFVQFKDLMERLLETMMSELGCSGEDLVAILEESIRNGPTGERRFLIKTLLSFEDYMEFHARISEYAAQQQDGENRSERSEWEMQLAVAQSLLDAQVQGLLDEPEQSFLPWAEALVGMGHATQAPVQLSDEYADAKEESWTGPVETSTEADERLAELEYTLIKERLKVDLLVAQRIAEANSTMKRDMLHLSTTEVQQEEQETMSAEQSLESLFGQLETVQDRLKVVKSKCFEFKNVSQEAMDQMYLFLKEKIHYQQDLVTQEKEISDYVFSLIYQSDAPLIPLMLEWLLLESESLRVQGHIQEELGQGGTTDIDGVVEGDGFWTQSWDENAQAFFYFHSVTGESVWEPPSVGYYDANQEFQFPDPISNSSEAKEEQGDDQNLPLEADNTTTLYEVTSQLNEKISVSTPENPNEMFEMERVLERISREHDEERKRLELVFELEKARQKEELRRRKEKKRREKHLKKKKKAEREQRHDDDADQSQDRGGAKDEYSDAIEAGEVPTAPTPRQTKAEAKEENPTNHLSLAIPGRGRLELAHLLSETHAKRQLEKNGLTVPLAPAPQALLNPTSLRYLAETLAKKNIGGWTDESPKSSRPLPPVEIVLEEVEEK